MHVDDVVRNIEVCLVILLVEDQEEDVEARHDRSGHVQVVA